MQTRTLMMNLPNTIKGFVVSDGDDYFTICLNENLSHEQNLLTYQHELKHIINGDFDKKCSADLIELYAHRGDL